MENIIKLLVLLIIMSNNIYGQQDSGFVLNGKIEGMRDKTSLYLILGNDTVARTKSNGSSFSFEGIVEGSSNFYFISADTSNFKKNSMALWLVNNVMYVYGDVRTWPSIHLEGSTPHNEYMEVLKIGKEVNNRQKRNAQLMEFINSHPNSPYVPMLIIKLSTFLKSDEMIKAYNSLSASSKQSFYGKRLKKELDNITKAEKLMKNADLGNTIPNFHISSPAGNKVAILSIASQSLYTLIDFWASWCVPCRESIPELKKTFNAFHSRGFNIISISIDKNKNEWMKAVINEKMPWLQGLDNIEFASKSIFGLASIPGYFLIDQKGKIVQADYSSFANTNSFKIKNVAEKSLSSNLYKVIEELFKEENGK